MTQDVVRSWFGQPGRRLVEHFRVPVYRQGYALVLRAGLCRVPVFDAWWTAAGAAPKAACR